MSISIQWYMDKSMEKEEWIVNTAAVMKWKEGGIQADAAEVQYDARVLGM